MKQDPIRQVVFPILAALIWGTAFVAQDVCADTIGTFTFNAARYAIAVLALLVLYYLVPKRFQWVVLLIGSYAFYAFVCLRYMGFIVVTTLTTYFGARGMDAMTAHRRRAQAGLGARGAQGVQKALQVPPQGAHDRHPAAELRHPRRAQIL